MASKRPEKRAPKKLASKPKHPRKASPPPPPRPRDEARSFPIVGIGASAGGLEAIEQFLSQVPATCGMAFVIVQHLDPTQKGMMVELLARATPLKVVQVKDRLRVEPN